MNYFRTFTSKDDQEKSFEQVLDLILSDEELKKSTISHRELLARGLEEAAKKVKESTPQVAISFRMEGGKGKENCRECLNAVLVDFDAKKPGERLPAEELERVKNIMRTRQHTMLGYESISGLGYHAIVPFQLPEGITIDLAADRKRGEEIFKRACAYITKVYSVWCEHAMDSECGNINRMTGLCHDPQAVYRPDAYPFMLTRENLGIDDDGNFLKLTTSKQAYDQSGKRISVALGNSLERAVEMVEEGGIVFEKGNRHNFIMRVSFILNRFGVDEEEAAQALDDAYMGKMEGRPSMILRSCYRTAADEFGAWMPRHSKTKIKSEMIANFLREKSLRFDVLSQKTQQLRNNGHWTEMTERDENDLYLECCSHSSETLSQNLFLTVLNSNVIPVINPLRHYIDSLSAWSPDMSDYIAEAASTVHMSTPEEDAIWQRCFRKWLVAMVAGWIEEGIVNHQIIVLVGDQGIYKSTWLNCLMPPQLSEYVSDDLDIVRLDKDEKLRAAEFGIINIDELDKLSDGQLNTIKSMITTAKVDVRASYGRHKEKHVRVASYVASGNKLEFLTDQTGNRRWLPFHVISIDSPYDHPMPYDGMYAQALYLFRNGFNYWFDLNDINSLKTHVEEFMVPMCEEELVMVYFSPTTAEEPAAEFLTLSEIAAKITVAGSLRKPIDTRKLGAILKKNGFVPYRAKDRNRTRGYIVREHTQMELDRLHDPKAK